MLLDLLDAHVHKSRHQSKVATFFHSSYLLKARHLIRLPAFGMPLQLHANDQGAGPVKWLSHQLCCNPT